MNVHFLRRQLVTAFVLLGFVLGCLSVLSVPVFAQVNSYSQTNTTVKTTSHQPPAIVYFATDANDSTAVES